MGQITLTELNYMEGARFLGYGTGTPDDRVKAMMEDCSRQICSQANPRFVYRIFELTKDGQTIGLAGTTRHLSGNSIREHLDGCEHAILLCATLSDTIDRLIRKYEISDMAMAVIMDAMAGVAIEQVCDKAEDIIRNEYEKVYGKSYFTWRYGYGYGDLPLQEEKAALQLLESEKRIGVGISDSLIMFPRKTVACIIGISKTEIKSSRKGCISCNMRERCKFRQRGERCGF